MDFKISVFSIVLQRYEFFPKIIKFIKENCVSSRKFPIFNLKSSLFAISTIQFPFLPSHFILPLVYNCKSPKFPACRYTEFLIIIYHRKHLAVLVGFQEKFATMTRKFNSENLYFRTLRRKGAKFFSS